MRTLRTKKTKEDLRALRREARDAQWKLWCDATYEGKPSGNALHAIKCRETPLEPKAILDLVVENLGYYGDSYYAPLTDPVDLRVEEFYESLGERVSQGG